jgi:hypothetical protein
MPRLFLLLLLAAAVGCAAEPRARPWPFWDGEESLQDYGRRVGLPPAKILVVGNGVKLDLVLIPAGEFLMGAPVHMIVP